MLRVPAQLDQLPWEFAKDEFRAYLLDSTMVPGTLPRLSRKPRSGLGIVNPQATMQLEFHQLDRRWEHLRVRQPHRQQRLMASLAESGQQTPIVVVLCPEERERYLGTSGWPRWSNWAGTRSRRSS